MMIEHTFELTIYLYIIVIYSYITTVECIPWTVIYNHVNKWHKFVLHSTAPLQLQRSESVRHDTNPYVADCVICRSSFVYI